MLWTRPKNTIFNFVPSNSKVNEEKQADGMKF